MKYRQTPPQTTNCASEWASRIRGQASRKNSASPSLFAVDEVGQCRISGSPRPDIASEAVTPEQQKHG
ncbi:MAG: hypothetical protein R6V58_11785, partial [Planctomycetota bacterium]